tara:strand:+ start:7429 stop:8805 length:1377 start_codon:yes stop_codon:yes gene_type:complete
MAKTRFDFDLIVIGSGAGGSAAATIAAREGKRVAIVEADTFGGTSPNWGDVPIKSLLHATQLYDQAQAGSRFGLRTATLGYNYPSLLNWKELAVKRTGAGGNRAYYDNAGVTTLHGLAHFLSPHEINVNRRHYSSEQFLIATGADWKIPDIQGTESLSLLTPRDLLEQTRLPKSLYIIGGGTTGVEIAQLMSTLGVKVTIADIASRLLPGYESEAGELTEHLLRKQKGVSILTQTRTLAIEKENIAYRVTYSRGGQEHSVRVDHVLVCAGRRPNVDLGLENAGVEYSDKGIVVDKHLQTSAKHIYATGDVLGQVTGHTHTALLQSRVAAHNILSKKATLSPDYTGTPHVIFTYPSIASVGLNEDDCLRRDLHIKKALVPLSVVARSNVSDFKNGFVKLIADKKGVLIGATVMAPDAGEAIHELALAIKHDMTAAQIAETPHAFLTWSEAIRVAANKLS